MPERRPSGASCWPEKARTHPWPGWWACCGWTWRPSPQAGRCFALTRWTCCRRPRAIRAASSTPRCWNYWRACAASRRCCSSASGFTWTRTPISRWSRCRRPRAANCCACWAWNRMRPYCTRCTSSRAAIRACWNSTPHSATAAKRPMTCCDCRARRRRSRSSVVCGGGWTRPSGT